MRGVLGDRNIDRSILAAAALSRHALEAAWSGAGRGVDSWGLPYSNHHMRIPRVLPSGFLGMRWHEIAVFGERCCEVMAVCDLEI